jgi:hypothetical protein
MWMDQWCIPSSMVLTVILMGCAHGTVQTSSTLPYSARGGGPTALIEADTAVPSELRGSLQAGEQLRDWLSESENLNTLAFRERTLGFVRTTEQSLARATERLNAIRDREGPSLRSTTADQLGAAYSLLEQAELATEDIGRMASEPSADPGILRARITDLERYLRSTAEQIERIEQDMAVNTP